jgi:hypothetical protein
MKSTSDAEVTLEVLNKFKKIAFFKKSLKSYNPFKNQFVAAFGNTLATG